MNKRGQTIGISVIIAIVFFIVGFMMLNFIRDEVTIVRLSTGLDCSNSDVISDGTKLTCLAVDIIIPYFLLIILSGVVGVISSKFLQ